MLQARVAAGSGSASDGRAYSGDAVSLGGVPVAAFNSKDVATASTVSFSGLSLTGLDAGNYSLNPHASASHATHSRNPIAALKRFIPVGARDMMETRILTSGGGRKALSMPPSANRLPNLRAICAVSGRDSRCDRN